ncbi:MAG: Cna B-type domain-containing protein [Clostridia bacterium]|nr:Cna B-type domain-containing protein [Clostridia bacterium]
MTANEGWTYTFTAPAEKEDRTKIVYTVEEEQVKGFIGTVSGDQESGFTVTNKPVTEPDTGDHWNVLRWAVTSAISLIGIAVILLIYRRTNEKAC